MIAYSCLLLPMRASGCLWLFMPAYACLWLLMLYVWLAMVADACLGMRTGMLAPLWLDWWYLVVVVGN